MYFKVSYEDLLLISSALTTIENVYGNGTTIDLQDRIESCMNAMDNAPITELYPYVCEGVGTVNT